MDNDTIAAIATASGKGGIGIVRLSGKSAYSIAEQLTLCSLKPRYATFCSFNDASQNKLDEGIAIYYPAPHSFTGEDIIELQGHGGAYVLDSILQEAIKQGARLARPGEFSERAFLNNKIDLVQAEAIADLIESTSISAAQSAVLSLSGEFSSRIHTLVEEVTQLRIYVEAAIDFPEEEIDFVSDAHIKNSLTELISHIDNIQQQAKQGVTIREGLSLIIIGNPNTGKSSLLNCLAGEDLAITNPQAGTTRDLLRETINLDGLPLKIIDTAGLRKSDDEIEQEGIRRLKKAIEQVDIVLYMQDASHPDTCLQPSRQSIQSWLQEHHVTLPQNALLLVINNKIDLTGQTPSLQIGDDSLDTCTVISTSAKQGAGLDILAGHVKAYYGIKNDSEGIFIARRRHLDIIDKSKEKVLSAEQQLLHNQAGELLAEDLRQVQLLLGEITGQVSSDDLLGEIFSGFCIGK